MKRSCLPRNGEPVLFPTSESFSLDFAKPEPVTVIAVDLDDLRATEKEDARWQRQWDETAVQNAANALPPRINDEQTLFLLRALLKAYDQEGEAHHALEACIDRVVEEMLKESAEEQYALLCHPNSLP